MAITPMTGTALKGIQRGMHGIRRNAAEIASPGQASTTLPTKDAVRAMVELHQNKIQTASSLTVFRTADQMIGSLLDIKA